MTTNSGVVLADRGAGEGVRPENLPGVAPVERQSGAPRRPPGRPFSGVLRINASALHADSGGEGRSSGGCRREESGSG
jgi:hypothetical protein